MRIPSFVLLVSLVLVPAFDAWAGRPIPIHHRESAYTGSAFWATTPYTRGYELTVTRNLTLRGLSIYADFAGTETCEPRVYDAAGALRTNGPPQSGIGSGTGAGLDWWTLPIDAELYAGERVTLAVYCTTTSTTSYYPHRDPATVQLDAEGYFADILNRSFFGDGFPNGTNTWWGDWRLEIEGHGLHDQYVDPSQLSTTGTMSSSRGAILTTTRAMSITGVDLYLDLDPGETCQAQIFDAVGNMIATGASLNGDGGGLHWYHSDVAVWLYPGQTYTIAQYCAQTTGYGRFWNDEGTYTLVGDAVNVHGRSGGGNGIIPTSVNAITPIMQLHEAEISLTDREATTPAPSISTWSEWTWGWRITPVVDMTLDGIEALMNRSSGSALARVYDTDTGRLLATGRASMPTSAQLEWRLAPLPNVTLLAGRSYTVAVYYSGGAISQGPYVPNTSAGTYSRNGVLAGIDFCGSGSGSDVMPTSCNFNHRLERLKIRVPEPGLGLMLGMGSLALGALRQRRRSR